MTENDKINGWTFEETVKTSENLMEVEENMYKWDVLRHIRDFAEYFKDELEKYRALGTVEQCKQAMEKQKAKKANYDAHHRAGYRCPTCNNVNPWGYNHCKHCGQELDWSQEE